MRFLLAFAQEPGIDAIKQFAITDTLRLRRDGRCSNLARATANFQH